VTQHTDIDYMTLGVSHPDEVESLASYLNEHGIFAIASIDENSVRAASGDSETDAVVRTLKTTWRRFWDNSDSGLLGLPMFIKES